jgi:hypothetical protein
MYISVDPIVGMGIIVCLIVLPIGRWAIQSAGADKLQEFWINIRGLGFSVKMFIKGRRDRVSRKSGEQKDQ